MADERDTDPSTDDQNNGGPAGESSPSSRSGLDRHEPRPGQGAEGSFGGQSGVSDQVTRPSEGGGMSGQPIGGNDSSTGSGTTLTSGYTPPSAGYEQRLASNGTGALAAEQGRDSATHTHSESGQGATNGGGSSLGTSQASGGSSGVSGGEGFIGSQGSGSDDYLQERGGSKSSSSASATGGSDFAEQGRGALEDENEDDESGSGSTAGGA